MRIAILTVIEPAGANLAIARGLLEVGGIAVVRHQLGAALALGCQRVICIAREFSPGMVALQHAAEQGGAQFHVISGARPLAGLITVADEIVLLGDGLLLAPHRAADLLGSGACVLVQPAEIGLAAGFERIDQAHASAGAARLPGRLAARLADLPPDCDIASALTRIALQAGISQRMVPAELRDSMAWMLVRDEDDAHRIEPVWLRQNLGAAEGFSPGDGLARLTVRYFGAALLHDGGGGRAAMIAAAVLLLLALVAAWLEYQALALALLGLAWFAKRTAALLRRIARHALLLPASALDSAVIVGWLIDVLLIALPVIAVQGQGWALRLDAAFAPLMLIALLRMLAATLPRRGGIWLEDRLVLMVLLAVAAASAWLVPAIKVLAVILALTAAARSLGFARITRT